MARTQRDPLGQIGRAMDTVIKYSDYNKIIGKLELVQNAV